MGVCVSVCLCLCEQMPDNSVAQGLLGPTGCKLDVVSSVSLRGKALTGVPNTITQYTHLKVLDLSNNALTAFPDVLGHLTTLNVLNVANNPMETISPSVMRALATLQTTQQLSVDVTGAPFGSTLDWSFQGLTSDHVPDNLFFFVFSSLSTLRLRGNNFTSVPDAVLSLPRLNTLDLSRSGLRSAGQLLDPSVNIPIINVSHNGLGSVEVVLPGLSAALRLLDLSFNALTSLPAAIGTYGFDLRLQGNNIVNVLWGKGATSVLRPWIAGLGPTLRLFDVNNNFIVASNTSWPWLPALSGLEVLNFFDSSVQEVPHSVFDLANLRVLFAGGAALVRLDGGIARLTRLRLLDISRSFIERLPAQLGELTELKGLLLESSRFLCDAKGLVQQVLPRMHKLQLFNASGMCAGNPNATHWWHWFNATNMTRLVTLSLQGQRLLSVPAWIGRLDALRVMSLEHAYINLDNNPYSNSSSGGLDILSNMTALEMLDLSDNMVAPLLLPLPPNLLQLKLEACGLRELPSHIGRLTKLVNLRLQHNQLSSLPSTLVNLTSLAFLDLRLNNFTSAPDVVVDMLLRLPTRMAVIMDKSGGGDDLLQYSGQLNEATRVNGTGQVRQVTCTLNDPEVWCDNFVGPNVNEPHPMCQPTLPYNAAGCCSLLHPFGGYQRANCPAGTRKDPTFGGLDSLRFANIGISNPLWQPWLT